MIYCVNTCKYYVPVPLLLYANLMGNLTQHQYLFPIAGIMLLRKTLDLGPQLPSLFMDLLGFNQQKWD